MEIEPILLQYGITENIINFFHSRTKNSNMTIVKVYKASGFSLLMDGQEGIKVDVTLKQNELFGEDIIHHVQYTIDVAKIRQKRLNLLLKTK